MKKVSVLIPLYNAEKYIAETIQSVLHQTYKNIEIIIVDDGSTDKSFEIAKEYESPNIIVAQQLNRGPGGARNKAFELSSGNYIQYLDADDLLSENKIETQLNELLKYGDDTFVLGDMAEFYSTTASSKRIHHDYIQNYENPIEFLVNYWSHKGMIGTHTFLISRNAVISAGIWNEKWILNEDGEFISRLIATSNTIIYTPDTIAYYRKSNVNSLNSHRTEQHYLSQLESFSSYKSLAQKFNNTHLFHALAIKYSRLLYYLYPSYPNLRDDIIKRLNELGYSKPIPLGSKKITFFMRLVGYKNALFLRKYLGKTLIYKAKQ